MGTIWVREFTGGLDTRRLPETSSGAVLTRATDGHISRGGEFEKRAAFVPTYGLPSGTTFGMAYDKSGIYVFSHLHPDLIGGTLPKGVTLQRLQHPVSSETALAKILSFDNYAGKIYAVAEFADGGRYHFYDGVLVEDFKDGRARATFTITGGGVTPAVAATGSFKITGGSSGVGNQITSISINGVALTAGPVSFGSNADATAASVASAINGYVSTPDYVATSSSNTVTITSVNKDASVNGVSISVAVGGNVTVGNFVAMSGGASQSTSVLTALTVGGVDVLGATVSWRNNNADTASAIADQINTYASNPNYSAVANGASVSILADVTGAAANGRPLSFSTANGLTIFFSGPSLELSRGLDTATSYTPGTFVKTIGSRMHTVAGANEHGSGLSAPTAWTTATTGAYFIDMSTQAGGSEQLTSIAKYQRWTAVFSERVIQVWNFDSDPNNNSQVQVMNNTGTASPKSVTPFSDNDLFYCAESGIRSLRARDASNAAATTDIGVPVDTLVTTKLRTLSSEWRSRVTGLIEPRDGRFWLIMKDVAYVFSYFPGAKISAWSQYNFGFDVTDAFVFGRRVYLRSGDTIYVYGGLGDETVYDATQAEAWLPYLDADKPSRIKHFSGLDAALQGAWQVSLSMRPDQYTVYDDGPIITATTYGLESIPITGASTHLSVRLRSTGTGPAKLGALMIHYAADADED